MTHIVKTHTYTHINIYATHIIITNSKLPCHQTSTYIIYADTKKTLSDPTICVLYLATLFIVQSCVERRRGRAFDQTTSEDQVIHTLTHNYCERNIPTSNF
ncbi:hypothetical protein EON63_18090 [archaeon]|nr:MAG: hypothetical protein EON63_18090 [archaeon]